PPVACAARRGRARRTARTGLERRGDRARADEPADPRRIVDGRARGAPTRLERSLLRTRARIERPLRAGGAADGTVQSRPVRRRTRVPFPLLEAVRLRRLGRDGRPLPRPPRRGRDSRRDPDPARALGHASRRHAGARLAHRRPSGMTSGEPTSWLVVEKGWRVVAADGTDVGKVTDVIGDT